MYSAALFQYMGDSRLTVIGAGTKTVYQFNGRGSRVVVNGRDVASLGAVPLLIRV